MENASKALLMAGGILIALMILAVLMTTFSNMSQFQKTQLSEEEQEQIIAFNKQYLKYLGQYVYGTDVVTIINKSLNDKENDITVSIKFIGGYTYNGYKEVFRNGKKRWEKAQITIGEGRTIVIENNQMQDENMISFINSLGDTDLNTMAFKCTNIEYDSDGRVKSIKFEEKEWSDLYE